MAQIPASRGVQTQKLDEILRKLEGQPSVEDWHEMATVLSEVSMTMRAVEKKVTKLDEYVITGNGKDPPLMQRVDLLERVAGWSGRAFWGALTVIIAAIGLGIVRLIQLGAGQ